MRAERLPAEGWEVRALARSERAAWTVAERGAQAVSGDLVDGPDLTLALGTEPFSAPLL